MPVIRGATTCVNNNKEEILQETETMLTKIIEINAINIDDIVSILFTMTKDLDKVYPAVSARNIGIINAGLMCMAELYIEGSLEKCIRVLVTINSDKKQKDMKHVYLNEAKKLRPDLLIQKTKKIAIDGPGGSGKGTVAKTLAKDLGYVYIDTGAMYRAVGLYCIENNVNVDIEEEVSNILKNVNIYFNYENGQQRIYLNDNDITDKIRSLEVSQTASKVAVISQVRHMLVDMQRKIATESDVVMDGRDIGSHVLVDADLKIYLDAKSSERARRRVLEYSQNPTNEEIDLVKKEIEIRDNRDKTREESPLVQTDDAVYIDTTNITADEAISMIKVLYEKRR